MTRATPDPIAALEHDHTHLGALVSAVREAMNALGTGDDGASEVADTLRLLQDDLLSHFAREEEGLFPVVLAELPQVADQVAVLVASHDRIVGVLSRMMHAAHDGPALRQLFERFDDAYGTHAEAERLLLRTLDTKLPPRARAKVADVLKSL